MKITNKKLTEIMPYEKNPRNNEAAVDKVASSIQEFGFKQPIVIDAAGVIVVGHTRYLAAKQLGLEEVPCVTADDLDPYQIKAYRLADNKVAEFSEWDFSLLDKELEEIGDFEMGEITLDDLFSSEDSDSFDTDITNGWEDKSEESSGALLRRYVIPPFSVFDTRAGYWQKRKKEWISYGIDSGDGRDENLLGGGLNKLAHKSDPNTSLTGTSIFDPVLAEITYRWFCVPDGKVFDCFAGGSVRGIVAKLLGYEYTGIELRKEQVEANENCSEKLKLDQHWICDDSLNADKYVDDNSVDLLFTCPPYGDLEKYSDDPRDISNMDYDEFLKTYREILSIGSRKVKNNRFAVIVISDIRDKDGFFRGLPDSTIQIMKDNGFEFYNDVVLLNAIATASLRVNNIFQKNRKVVKVHQRVLIFYKGNVEEIRNNFPELDFSDLEETEEE